MASQVLIRDLCCLLCWDVSILGLVWVDTETVVYICKSVVLHKIWHKKELMQGTFPNRAETKSMKGITDLMCFMFLEEA